VPPATTNKIRVTVHLTEPTHVWCKTRAREMGISLADFVRRVLDDERLEEKPAARRATR
jgi:hypothetical protein